MKANVRQFIEVLGSYSVEFAKVQPVLEQYLRSDDQDVALAATKSLGRQEAAAVKVLVDLVEHG